MKIDFVKKILMVSFMLLLFFNIFSLPVSAGIKFTPQIAIGSFVGDMEIDSDSIGKYIMEVYKYLIGIVGILATVVMMIGGVIWITSGGNASLVGNAKAWISGALMGLVLALSSYTLLHTINPDLVSIKNLDIKSVKGIEHGVSGDWSGTENYICCQKSWLEGTEYQYECIDRLESEGCPENNLSFSTWTHKNGFCDPFSGKCSQH